MSTSRRGGWTGWLGAGCWLELEWAHGVGAEWGVGKWADGWAVAWEKEDAPTLSAGGSNAPTFEPRGGRGSPKRWQNCFATPKTSLERHEFPLALAPPCARWGPAPPPDSLSRTPRGLPIFWCGGQNGRTSLGHCRRDPQLPAGHPPRSYATEGAGG